jgi:fibro-slime domain-containing protein
VKRAHRANREAQCANVMPSLTRGLRTPAMRALNKPITILVVLVGCGPDPRRPSEPDATKPIDAAAPLPDAPPPDAAPPCGQVTITYRDFRSSHADMQKGVGIDTGLVQAALGAGNKPVYAPAGATGTVSGAASFDQWYRDVANVNTKVTAILPLVENPPGTFTFDSQSFFPLDGMGFGNEGNTHNFHFTSEIHTTFTYHGGETFQFTGDDDVFVFVNKKLAIDLGGVHDPLSQTIDFDLRATEFGIAVGGTYQLDVFHAERHTVSSTFRMATTIDCLVVL